MSNIDATQGGEKTASAGFGLLGAKHFDHNPNFCSTERAKAPIMSRKPRAERTRFSK